MTTTAAVYPEVLAELERPDRIRREAFELLKRGEFFKLPDLNGWLRFTVARDRGGHVQIVRLDVVDRTRDAGDRATAVEAMRSDALRQLIELLEGEPELVD